MLPTEVRVGWIFRYAYLWDWQHREGREEGDKDRPCLVLAIVMTTEEGAPIVRVLPITHTPPVNPADAIEIPADVKGRLRLDADREQPLRLARAGPAQHRYRERLLRRADAGPFRRGQAPLRRDRARGGHNPRAASKRAADRVRTARHAGDGKRHSEEGRGLPAGRPLVDRRPGGRDLPG